MTAIDILKLQSVSAYADLVESLEGVTQGQAWAVLPQGGPDYLNSDGSIRGIALHVATCKLMYASIGFRDTEIRWRDCAEQVEKFEPDCAAAFAYLEEAKAYWMRSRDAFRPDGLEKEVPHFSGKLWPAWKVIRMVIYHDSYHAGQIAVLRYAVGESKMPPPSVAEDIRKYCGELPSW